MKIKPYKSYTYCRCKICRKTIKPRNSAYHKYGVCHQCRCKTLKGIEKYGIQWAMKKGLDII